MRVFAGNRNDPTPCRIRSASSKSSSERGVGLRRRPRDGQELSLGEAGLRYITALTDPQIRRRLSEGVLQLELFAEQVCEVEADGVRYVLRLNESEAKRQRQRLEDKLAKLGGKLDRRNQKVTASSRLAAPAQALAGASQADRIGRVALAGTYAGRRAPAGGDRAGLESLLRGRDTDAAAKECTTIT